MALNAHHYDDRKLLPLPIGNSSFEALRDARQVSINYRALTDAVVHRNAARKLATLVARGIAAKLDF